MEPLLEIESSHIAVKIDLKRGGTISHIGKTLDESENVLAWYKWDSPEELPIEYPHGESDHYWLSRYRGGWQFLTPNADNECDAGGRHHSFHGESSILPWKVTAQQKNEVTIQVEIFNTLRVDRIISLDENKSKLRVKTAITNFGLKKEPFIKVEHIAYRGSDNGIVIGPENTIWKFAKNYEEGFTDEFAWKEMDSVGVDLKKRNMKNISRLAFIVKGSEGWSQWYNPELDRTTRATWDPKEFPHLWYWQENGSAEFPFFGRSKITALEPASVPPGTQLDGALEKNLATFLEPGQSHYFEVGIEIL